MSVSDSALSGDVNVCVFVALLFVSCIRWVVLLIVAFPEHLLLSETIHNHIIPIIHPRAGNVTP